LIEGLFHQMISAKFYICASLIALFCSLSFCNVCFSQEHTGQKSGMVIYLFRHARPDLPDVESLNYDEMVEYYNLYDAVDIVPFDKNIVLEQIDDQIPDMIFTSMLPRTKQTARHAFGDQVKYIHNSVFNEFGRNIVYFPSVSLPKGFWSVFSRMTWAIGFNGESESFRDAKKRAGLSAMILEDVVMEEKIVILVGHGYMNHYIKKELKRDGWKTKINHGKKNLGVIKMVKYD